jgi:hypothetical protein
MLHYSSVLTCAAGVGSELVAAQTQWFLRTGWLAISVYRATLVGSYATNLILEVLFEGTGSEIVCVLYTSYTQSTYFCTRGLFS